MDDAEIVAAQRAGHRRFHETMVGAPRTFVHREPGLLALVTPDVVGAPFFNAVVYDDAPALVHALPTLDAMYVDAGVKAWAVWVHHDDPETAAACERAGHRLEATPALMGATIADLDLAARSDVPLDEDPAWRTVGNLNGIAYGGAPTMGDAIAGMATDDHVRVVALLDGRAAACAAGLLHDGNCEVGFVATLPQARRQGLAGHCTTAVLRAARQAGATTTTLESTVLGWPVYERIGYRSIGHLQMWERRRP